MSITSAMAYILPARILILYNVKQRNESRPDASQIKDYILGNYKLMFWNRRLRIVECVWNVMTHAQKPDFVFRQNTRIHCNRRGRQFSRLLAVELCVSACRVCTARASLCSAVMWRLLAGELCTSACRVCTARASLCSAVMWRLLVTHSIHLFPLHFSSHASPCAITFQTQSNFSVCIAIRCSHFVVSRPVCVYFHFVVIFSWRTNKFRKLIIN